VNRRTLPAILFLAASDPVLCGEAWRSLAPVRTPRQEVGVAELGGRVYVIGGILAGGAATGIVERYDPLLDAWEPIASLPRRLHHIGAAALDGRVYALGGLDGGFDGVNACFRYDPEADAWEDIAPLPTRRGAMGVAVLGGRILAAGGQRTNATVREFAAFTPGPGGGSWETLPDMPTARNHLAAGAALGFFFSISGRGAGLRAEVERYDPVLRVWSAVAPIPTPRGGIALAAIGRRLYVFGGEGNRAVPSGVFPQTEMYDADLDRWLNRLDMSIPRHGIGAVALGGAIFIPGGSEVEGFGVSAANTAYAPPAEDLDPALFLRGDSNQDGAVDLSDAVAILFRLFAEGPAAFCPDAADANDDGRVDISDAIRILERLFLDGPVLPPPAGSAGLDPTPDALGC